MSPSLSVCVSFFLFLVANFFRKNYEFSRLVIIEAYTPIIRIVRFFIHFLSTAFFSFSILLTAVFFMQPFNVTLYTLPGIQHTLYPSISPEGSAAYYLLKHWLYTRSHVAIEILQGLLELNLVSATPETAKRSYDFDILHVKYHTLSLPRIVLPDQTTLQGLSSLLRWLTVHDPSYMENETNAACDLELCPRKEVADDILTHWIQYRLVHSLTNVLYAPPNYKAVTHRVAMRCVPLWRRALRFYSTQRKENLSAAQDKNGKSDIEVLVTALHDLRETVPGRIREIERSAERSMLEAPVSRSRVPDVFDLSYVDAILCGLLTVVIHTPWEHSCDPTAHMNERDVLCLYYDTLRDVLQKRLGCHTHLQDLLKHRSEKQITATRPRHPKIYTFPKLDPFDPSGRWTVALATLGLSLMYLVFTNVEILIENKASQDPQASLGDDASSDAAEE